MQAPTLMNIGLRCRQVHHMAAPQTAGVMTAGCASVAWRHCAIRWQSARTYNHNGDGLVSPKAVT